MHATNEDLRDFARGNRALPSEQKCMLIGVRSNASVVSSDLSMSYLIGGMPGMGKSTVAAWLCCMMVLTGGQLVLIDPHCHEPKNSLFGKIEPLTPWFATPTLDFEEMRQITDVFTWLDGEYEARKRKGGMAGKQPLLLVIDEFNELLNELHKPQRDLALKVLTNIIRGGRKHGMLACLSAQNWDLSGAGGRHVRTNIGCKICTYADPLEMKMVLNIDDLRLIHALPPLKKGLAHVKMPFYPVMQLTFPSVNREFCAALAQRVQELEEELACAEPCIVATMPDLPMKQQHQPPVLALSAPNVTTHPITMSLPCTEPLVQPSVPVAPAQGAYQEEVRGACEEEKITHFPVGEKSALQATSHEKWAERGGKCTSASVEDIIIRMHCQGWKHDAIANHQAVRMGGRKYPHYKAIYRSLGIPSGYDDAMNDQTWRYLQAYYDYRCLACGRRFPEVKLDPDHIVPRSKGGSDAIWNRQPLCTHCNRVVKNDQFTDYRPERRSAHANDTEQQAAKR